MDPSRSKQHPKHSFFFKMGVLAVFFALFAPSPLLARHKSARSERKAQEQAEELRKQGADALAAGKLDDARKAFYDSYERQPAPETLYYLGLLADAENRGIEAQDLLRRFVRELAEAVDAKQREQVSKILLKPITPYGELDVIGERGALLSVDGRLLGVLPLSQPMLMAPGAHTVQLRDGGKRFEGPVEIRAGRTAQLRFDLRTGVAVVTLPPTVLLLEDYRDAPAATQTALAQAVEAAIRNEQFAILRAQAALVRAPELVPCINTRPCQEQLMQRNEVEMTLKLGFALPPTGDGRVVQGELIDAPTGDSIIAMTSLVDLNDENGLKQLPATVAALSKRLITESKTRPRGTLEVLSTPPGAEVVLTRGTIGATPYSRAAFAGQYEVTVKKPGYHSTRMMVTVEEGKKATVQALLQTGEGDSDGPQEPKSTSSRPLWRTITGAIGVGLGGTAFSVGLIGIGVSSIGSQVDSGSIAATVLGGLIAGGGIVLLALPVRKPKPVPVTAAPAAPGPATTTAAPAAAQASTFAPVAPAKNP